MFERYTEQARRAIFFARYAAGCLRAETISTAHLVLGLCYEEKSRFTFAVPLRRHSKLLYAQIGIPYPLPRTGYRDSAINMPLDKNLKLALGYAAEEADLDQQSMIDKDHLLRGLLRFPNETSKAFESISMDLETAREASKRYRALFPLWKVLFPRLRSNPSSIILQTRLFGVILAAVAPPLALLGFVTFVGLIAVLVIRWLNY